MKIPKKLFVIFGLFFMFYDDGAMAMQLSSRVSPVSSQGSLSSPALIVSSSSGQKLHNQNTDSNAQDLCTSADSVILLEKTENDFSKALEAMKSMRDRKPSMTGITVVMLCEALNKILEENVNCVERSQSKEQEPKEKELKEQKS